MSFLYVADTFFPHISARLHLQLQPRYKMKISAQYHMLQFPLPNLSLSQTRFMNFMTLIFCQK